MKLKELKHGIPPDSLLKINNLEYELVWISNYYDGMISGMLYFNSELFWFEMIRESTIDIDDGWYRQYGVVKLSEKQ